MFRHCLSKALNLLSFWTQLAASLVLLASQLMARPFVAPGVPLHKPLFGQYTRGPEVTRFELPRHLCHT